MTVAKEKLTPPSLDLDKVPEHASGTAAPGWWGMVLFIATEAMLFGTLFVTYFFLRFSYGNPWPIPPAPKPELSLPLVMTALLLPSSIPMHLADMGIRKGKQGRLKAGLLATFILGASFLGLQAYEYSTLLQEFTPTTNVYGSLFFTITGLHGSHVAVGLVLVLWTLVRAWRGHFSPQRHLTVENVALYWHFVDGIWVFVLSIIYLTPNL